MIPDKEGKVSVVTVLYNSTGVIENLLDSIRKTNEDGLVSEVIVIDNKSQDNSVDVVEKYVAEQAQNLGYEIKLIKNEKNLGFGRGNNVGARLAIQQFFLFSNPDIEFKDGVVGDMAGLLIENPKVGLVGPRIYFDTFSAHINPIFNPPVFILRSFFSNMNLGKLLGIKSVQPGEYRKSFQVVGAYMMVRTNEFLKVGGFDEDNFLYLEELMLSERLRNVGLETVKLWTSQEVDHRIAHSQFIVSNDTRRASVTKLDLYLQAERHYIENYMYNLIGNPVLDFVIRQIVRLIYKMRNSILAKPLYQRWLKFVEKDVVR